MEYVLSENNEKIFPHDIKEKTESKKHEEPVMSDLPSQDSDFTNEENHCSDETKLLLQVSLKSGQTVLYSQLSAMPREMGDMPPCALCPIGFWRPCPKTVTKFQNQFFKQTIKVPIVKKSNLQ